MSANKVTRYLHQVFKRAIYLILFVPVGLLSPIYWIITGKNAINLIDALDSWVDK